MDDAEKKKSGRDARSAGRSDATGREAGDAESRDGGEHRTTVKAESERLRDAEAAQAEHPDAVAGRGRATGEPPLEGADGDSRDATA